MKILILSLLINFYTLYTFAGAPSMDWKKPSATELKNKLTKIQYEVTQKEGTEQPFKNEFNDNKAAGIYVDIVSGEPLFSSLDKYDSGTGWPSFSKALDDKFVTLKVDKKLFSTRTEVRSAKADSHLGHVFDDGPNPTGKRFCMNSAAFRFIPVEQLEKEGYAEYLKLFDNKKKSSEQLVLAGGCFWCMEKPFEELPGVLSVKSGYSGGTVKNPTYEQVSSGSTGHIESVQIEYDPAKINIEKILEVYWKNVDPYDGAGQFCDKGSQYSSAIFYKNKEQLDTFDKSWKSIQKNLLQKGTLQTKYLPNSEFYAAEDYHQDYYKKNPIRYKYYRNGCGRDKRLKQIWK